MIKLFLKDLRYKQSIFAQDGANVSLLKIFLSDGTCANFLYRLMQLSAARKWSLPFALFFQYMNKLLNQCVIGLKADFESGFVLMHPVGVVVNSSVKGGERIVLESGVVIGGEKGKTPILGSEIFVGSGAKIIGGVYVGDNTKVGANAVVLKDVESGDTVVGIPAKPVKRKLNEHA
ncbi:MAG: serine O-acetyltransferase [Cognaticolwellia sp.]|jgi:serine O-acetyltransferase